MFEAAADDAPPALDPEGLRFEAMLSRLSATFINLPADQVDGQIERGLRWIVEFLGIERSSLAQFSEDGGDLVVTHSYTVPGFDPLPRINLAAAWPWYTAQIRQGKLLRFRRLPEEAPPEAVREREHVVRSGGPRSHLVVPFTVGDAVLGGVGVGSFRREVVWSDDLVRRLRLVGEVFANALARKRAEEQAARLREQLTLVARVTTLGELAASIAHEINQPLCAIVTNAQAVQHLLAGCACDLPEVREALEDISRDSRRAAAVLARIRGLLRKAPPERAPLDVNDLVREVLALARGDLSRRGIAVRLELAERLPPVRGDRVQLQQVVLNLLRNAADALDPVGPERRTLLLRSAADGSHVVLAVCDSGVGLAADLVERVFDAFFSTKPGGMGMGLAICRSIVAAHGGAVRAAPNPDRGCTFEVLLPCIPEGPP